MVNSNPETVSTDFDASSRLYFEPLDAESVLEVIDAETAAGAGAACRPSSSSAARRRSTWPARSRRPGVPLPGLDLEAIDRTEERTRFASLVDQLGIPQPQGGMATSLEEALAVADEVGYPVIVRPSFVIGGLAIDFCYGPEDLARQLATATRVNEDRPVRIDAYLEGLEVDVDAVTDGRACSSRGSWSTSSGPASTRVTRSPSSRRSGCPPPTRGSSSRPCAASAWRSACAASSTPSSSSATTASTSSRSTRAPAAPCPSCPRSRACPWWSWRPGWRWGARSRSWAGRTALLPPPGFVAVKAPVFSTTKLRGVDPSLGPGMQSTGEVIGLHTDARVAMAKALLAASLRPPVPDPDGARRSSPWHRATWPAWPSWPRPSRAVGYRFAATPGTAAALRAWATRSARPRCWATEGAGVPAILEVIASGEVSLVVNTPAPRAGPCSTRPPSATPRSPRASSA